MIADTNTYLLVGLEDSANERVWAEFCARYRPVLLSFGRRLGLREDDAQDAAQETLLAFADCYRRGQYTRDKGRLRNWLYGIARNQIHLLRRRDERQRATTAAEIDRRLEEQPEADELAAAWEEEWRRGLIQNCLEEAHRHFGEETVRAFVLFVLQEWPAEQVAEHLGMTRNAVFKAKRRVLLHMRNAYRSLDV